MVDIIIINHGEDNMLEKCLESIFNAADAAKLISSVTVRNSCGAYSPSFKINVINGKNIGYGAACNECAKRGTEPYILFLNPDVIMQKNALTAALDCIEFNPNIGILGIELAYEDGSTQASKMTFPTAKDLTRRASGGKRGYATSDQSITGEADWVLGAVILVRRSAFEAVGGFDESFFLYFEEVDLAKRMLKASWRCFYCAEAKAVHICGGAGGVSPFCAMQMARSRLIYSARYFTEQEFKCIYHRTIYAEPFLRFVKALLTGYNPISAYTAPLRGARSAMEMID